jgi:hypothetical protein
LRRLYSQLPSLRRFITSATHALSKTSKSLWSTSDSIQKTHQNSNVSRSPPLDNTNSELHRRRRIKDATKNRKSLPKKKKKY